MFFKTYIVQGHITQALEMLNQSEEQLLLLSRWNRLSKQQMIGTISDSEARTEKNRIISAAQQLYADQMKLQPTNLGIASYASPEANGQGLSTLYRHYKRRDTELAEVISQLIADFSNYETAKIKDRSFDVSGRRLKALKQRESEIVAKHKSLQSNSREEKVEKIKALITDPVPSYQGLSEAWAICQGLGMNSPWIAEALQNEASDSEVNIRIAESIEDFIAVL